MLHLIPAPLHRFALRLAHRVRRRFRKASGLPLRGVSVIVHDDARGVLLVRHSYASDKWALPGGGCRRGEEPHKTARREMREELGVDLSDLDLVGELSEELWGAPHTAFVLAGRFDGPVTPDNREIVAARFFGPEDLPSNISPLSAERIAMWRADQVD